MPRFWGTTVFCLVRFPRSWPIVSPGIFEKGGRKKKKNLKKGLQHKEKTHVLLLMEEILLTSWYSLFTGFDMFYTSQAVQDFFHQQ